MPLAYFFWGFYVIAIVFNLWVSYDGQPLWYRRAGHGVILWILVGMLGYRVFGHPVQ